MDEDKLSFLVTLIIGIIILALVCLVFYGYLITGYIPWRIIDILIILFGFWLSIRFVYKRRKSGDLSISLFKLKIEDKEKLKWAFLGFVIIFISLLVVIILLIWVMSINLDSNFPEYAFAKQIIFSMTLFIGPFCLLLWGYITYNVYKKL